MPTPTKSYSMSQKVAPATLQAVARRCWAAGVAAGASCPQCQHQLLSLHVRQLAPEAAEKLEEVQLDIYLQRHGIIRCPNASCQALIERISAAAAGSSAGGSSSSTFSAAAAASPGGAQAQQHRQQHYYRCRLCMTDFCDECRSTPYHDGFTCQQHMAPPCLFCDRKVLDQVLLEPRRSRPRELRQQLTALGVDTLQCLEHSDLLELARFRAQCCGDKGCLDTLNGSCLQLLPCGHHCCGRRGHGTCLPCLAAGCAASVSGTKGSSGCCFCLEALPSAPCLLLTCGHAVHIACASARLQARWPGPDVSFKFLFCPLCGSGEGRCGNIQVMTSQPHLQDESLQTLLEPLLQLRSQVVQLAKQRLQLEGLTKSDPELQPGGKFDGRPADYAMNRFMFYQCTKCKLPYFGGARACGAAADQQGAAAPFDVQELQCGGCSAGKRARCREHGWEFIEYKCYYCCALAAWFCFGTTHMCNACHEWATRGQRPPLQRCLGAGRCPLQLPHPTPGEEFCLGCGLCRRAQQQV